MMSFRFNGCVGFSFLILLEFIIHGMVKKNPSGIVVWLKACIAVIFGAMVSNTEPSQLNSTKLGFGL